MFASLYRLLLKMKPFLHYFSTFNLKWPNHLLRVYTYILKGRVCENSDSIFKHSYIHQTISVLSIIFILCYSDGSRWFSSSVFKSNDWFAAISRPPYHRPSSPIPGMNFILDLLQFGSCVVTVVLLCGFFHQPFLPKWALSSPYVREYDLSIHLLFFFILFHKDIFFISDPISPAYLLHPSVASHF